MDPITRISPEVRAIQAVGNELAKQIRAMIEVTACDAFKEAAPIDQHLFRLQTDLMQSTLQVLTIRLARANDRFNGILPDTASALGKRPAIIKPGDIH